MNGEWPARDCSARADNSNVLRRAHYPAPAEGPRFRVDEWMRRAYRRDSRMPVSKHSAKTKTKTTATATATATAKAKAKAKAKASSTRQQPRYPGVTPTTRGTY